MVVRTEVAVSELILSLEKLLRSLQALTELLEQLEKTSTANPFYR